MLQKIIVFLLFEGLGFLMIIKTDPIVKWVGRISFAEKYLGPAGTYAFLRILGGLSVIIGLLYITGLHNKALDQMFGWLAPTHMILFF